ncbi:PIG-L deacetylase family protein [Diaminobutyricimonas sp. LJ205]|uniref:PIG-L deacetylase family protein n=1 Tax=Diaminobutyricimonas sp. LJ205 TaxID=2683590 RepID=UPI0012F4BFDD|nr:PIG-L deacetylase family protein [Diaminobutyricimonas sp. LJ205]
MSAIVARIRRLARAAIIRRARDVTAESAGRSALVIAPHPDDETLGCGATILRRRATGMSVMIVIVTDGRHSHRSTAMSPDELAEIRRDEMRVAAERLGLEAGAVRWLDIEDGTVAVHEDRLVGLLGDLIDEFQPDDVFATCADEPHPDHAAVGRAARRAVAGARTCALFEYPVWMWRSWPLQPGHRLGSLVDAVAAVLGRRAVVVEAADFVSTKLHALDAHRSQVARPSWVSDGEHWDVLPQAVMEAAGEPVEVFFRR